MSFDKGSTGSDGPFLQWSARGTQDGEIGPKSWYIREQTGKTVFSGFDRGVPVDIASLKTGWCESEGVAGVAPKWVWGSSPARLPDRPADGWKKGLSLRVAVSKDSAATWEQSGAAAWNALCGLMDDVMGQEQPIGKVPVVKMTSTRAEKFTRGSTVTPVLEVVKWVDPPACFGGGFDAAADTPPPARPAPAPAAANSDDWG